MNENDAEIVDINDEMNEPAADEQSVAPAPDAAAAREADLMNKLMRLQADFDNFRKRSLAGRAEARDEARKELLLGLLPVYDNFIRAMDHAEEVEDYGSLRAGIQGILQQMKDFFSRQNLTEIDSAPGTPFDPNRHDAVGTVQGSAENHDTVAQEVLKGFELNGVVIRPATVLVFQGE